MKRLKRLAINLLGFVALYLVLQIFLGINLFELLKLFLGVLRSLINTALTMLQIDGKSVGEGINDILLEIGQ